MQIEKEREKAKPGEKEVIAKQREKEREKAKQEEETQHREIKSQRNIMQK